MPRPSLAGAGVLAGEKHWLHRRSWPRGLVRLDARAHCARSRVLCEACASCPAVCAPLARPQSTVNKISRNVRELTPGLWQRHPRRSNTCLRLQELTAELGELEASSDEEALVTTRVVRRRVIIQVPAAQAAPLGQ